MEITINENEPICANCVHFVQHYIYQDIYNRYSAVHLGHCTYPRVKNKQVCDSCERWEYGKHR